MGEVCLYVPCPNNDHESWHLDVPWLKEKLHVGSGVKPNQEFTLKQVFLSAPSVGKPFSWRSHSSHGFV